MVRNVISWLARGGDRSLDRKPGGVPCARVGLVLLTIGVMLLIGVGHALAMPQGALPSDEARTTEHGETSVPEAVDSTSGEPEGVREYRVSIGPFSRTIVVSESFDLLDLADRARGVVGIFAILAVAVFLSENWRHLGTHSAMGVRDLRATGARRHHGHEEGRGSGRVDFELCAGGG